MLQQLNNSSSQLKEEQPTERAAQTSIADDLAEVLLRRRRASLEDEEDLGALKRAKDHEKQKRKDAEAKLLELQAQLDEIQDKEYAIADAREHRIAPQRG